VPGRMLCQQRTRHRMPDSMIAWREERSRSLRAPAIAWSPKRKLAVAAAI
jgi:hypothetical protein